MQVMGTRIAIILNYVAIFRSKYSGIPYTSASTGRSKVGGGGS